MLIERLGDLESGSQHLSDSAAARGDGLAVIVLICVVISVVALMGAIAADKRKTFKTGEKAPRTGEYRAEAKAYHGEGRTIAPPGNETWKLEEAHISERWLVLVLLLCAMGVLWYSQVNVPGMGEAVFHSLGPASTPAPVHQPDHHVTGRHRPDNPRSHHRGWTSPRHG